jgi:hypothetical protein
MARFSKRLDAISQIKVTGMADAVMFLLDEQLKDAEEELLGANSADPRIVDKLVRVQTLRNLAERLRTELK